MYVRRHRVQNVKLLRDVTIDFMDVDDRPRMWTVFVGENRLCKTTLLQTIAAAASGQDRGTQLVTDSVASWPDLRRWCTVEIDTELGFSAHRHRLREYPGIECPASPPVVRSKLTLEHGKRVFGGGSEYKHMPRGPGDPLTQARIDRLPDWFVAGYGPSRLLPSAGSAPKQPDPAIDRLKPLFGGSLIGTGFIEQFDSVLRSSFVRVLKSVFVHGQLLPHVTDLELRGRGGIRSSKDLVDAQRFQMDVLDDTGAPIKVPAAWLSHGYQSMIAWVADFVGQILLEAGEPVEASEMEGVVLVDELDLHLHPTWQVRLVPALKRAFPRLQFIATTHSPMVLPGLDASEIYILEQDAEGSVTAEPATQSPALLTGSEILGAFFEIQRLYPHELGEKLSRYGYLATDPTRSEEEDAQMIKMRNELEAAGVEFDWDPVPREPNT